ncbi:MAG TPA: hypothetical protein VG435_14095 [Acidimicrobiales bacterium]|jgi:hypothetical protein|nr:hypothetical protein [Acidimicrobiales bacterium]
MAVSPEFIGEAADTNALLRSARAAYDRGHLGAARELYAAAARSAQAADDADSLVAAAIGIGGLWVYEQRDFMERIALENLWDRAERLVEPGSLDAARLRTRIAAEAVYQGQSIADVERAVEAVDRFHNPAASAQALSLLHHVLLGPAHAGRRLSMAEEMVRVAAEGDDDVMGLMGLCWRTIDLYLMGDRRADQSLRELQERADGFAALRFIVEVLDAMRLARAGQLADAEAAAQAACDRGVEAGDPDAMAYFGALLSALRWWQGRCPEIADSVRELASSPLLSVNTHAYVAVNALLSATVGDIDSAQEALAALRGPNLDTLPDNSSWLATLFLITEAAYLLGDADLAAQVAPLMAPYADLPVMPSLAVVCLGSAKRSLGLAATVAGDLDAGIAWTDAALADTERLGNRPMTALTGHYLAQMLEVRGTDADRARAAELFERSVGRAQRIGMVLPPAPSWLARRGHRHHARLVQEAGGWRIEVDGRTSMVAESIGMTYLAALLQTPSKERHVLDLAILEGSSRAGRSDDPVIDRQAMRNYRARVQELSEVVAGGGHGPRVEEARLEMESIRRLLKASTSWTGSARHFPTDQERARTSVRKALVRAIRATAESEPALAAHLESSVTTGSICCYRPDPAWQVEVSR